MVVFLNFLGGIHLFAGVLWIVGAAVISPHGPIGAWWAVAGNGLWAIGAGLVVLWMAAVLAELRRIRGVAEEPTGPIGGPEGRSARAEPTL